MALTESWHVRSRARNCATTERLFTDGEPIVTALFADSDSSGYVRRDFSLEAWKNRTEEPVAPFSFWHNTYSAPLDHTEENAARKLSAEELLTRLIDEDQDHTENTRYILAVMLERQRVLRETDNQRTADSIIRVYENRKTGDVFIVRDPNIPLEEVEAVQNEVMILLENNGRLPDPFDPSVTSDSPSP